MFYDDIQILKTFYSSYYIYHIFTRSLRPCQLHQSCHHHTAASLTAVRQVFTRSLCAHSVPIASILSPPHRCIAHRCKSGIHALTPSVPIASILSPPHRCIADRCTSGIHALTPCPLRANCINLVTAAPLHRSPL